VSQFILSQVRSDFWSHIWQRVEEKIGHPLNEEMSLHLVRSVAPNKEMYCISFRLPREVAFESKIWFNGVHTCNPNSEFPQF
jgi:hypothetical protein